MKKYFELTGDWNYQATTLRRIVKASDGKIKKIAEIGVWKSKTVKRVLTECHDLVSEYWAIDPWPIWFRDRWYSKKFNDEQWEDLYFLSCSLILHFPQLRVLRLDSAKAAEIFPDKYFDLVFIDAEHDYESMMKYIPTWLPKVRDGGLLTGHDYKARKFPGVEKAVTEYFGNDIHEAPGFVWIKQL